jgi:predicted alpha/beta-hydrolase family hydrolase
MRHAFLEAVAIQLLEHEIACLRYQFPYMERGSKRPDPPAVCHITVRDAVAEAASRCSAALFAGGRSFGGRMTSQAQSHEPLRGVAGLAFLGFPLHPAKKPSPDRAAHLAAVAKPMLFLQGTRDALADLELLKEVIRGLGARATLELFENADHSFHVPARNPVTDKQVLSQLVTVLAKWMTTSSLQASA